MNKGVIFVRVSKREQDYQRQLEDLRALRQEGLSMNQVSIRSGVTYGTVYNYLAKNKT